MPAWVSQHSDAVKKQNLIEKRLRRLRAAVREGEGSIHVSQSSGEGAPRGVGPHQGEARLDQRISAT